METEIHSDIPRAPQELSFATRKVFASVDYSASGGPNHRFYRQEGLSGHVTGGYTTEQYNYLAVPYLRAMATMAAPVSYSAYSVYSLVDSTIQFGRDPSVVGAFKIGTSLYGGGVVRMAKGSIIAETIDFAKGEAFGAIPERHR